MNKISLIAAFMALLLATNTHVIAEDFTLNDDQLLSISERINTLDQDQLIERRDTIIKEIAQLEQRRCYS